MYPNQVSVKVHYMENGSKQEIRKFMVDEVVATNYEYLVGKIKFFFIGLRRKDLELFWKDGDDDVCISSDEELFEMMKSIATKQGCVNLYIKDKNAIKPANAPHLGVICDICEIPINGIRYKCTVCSDFDLCSSCEDKGIHPICHDLLCIKKPRKSLYHPQQCLSQMKCFMKNHHCSCKESPFLRCQNNKEHHSKQECGVGNSPSQDVLENHQALKNVSDHIAAVFGLDPEIAFDQVKSLMRNLQCADFEKSPNHDSIGEHLSDCIGNVFSGKQDFIVDMVRSCLKSFSDNAFAESDGHKESKATSMDEQDSSNTDKADVGSEISTPENLGSGRNQTAFSIPNKYPTVGETNKISADRNAAEDLNKEQSTCSRADAEKCMKDARLPNQVNIDSEVVPEQFKNLLESIGNFLPNVNFDYSRNCEGKEKENHTSEALPVDDSTTVPAAQNASRNEGEIFQRRLEETLNQMISMGFKNDGGWLKQLLISNDLNVNRVLDSLNLPKM